MNLLEIRKQFIRVSGRYDLVVDTTDWVDNGANFYINSGQLYLDQKVETKLSESVFYKKLVAYSVGCCFPDCRAVREVWIQDYTNSCRYQLDKYSRQEVREYYLIEYSDVPSQTVYGYYLPTLRTYPDNLTIDKIESYIGWMDSQPSRGTGVYNGIIIVPPTDHEIVVEVIGLFSTPDMSEDTDETYWAKKFPALLIWSALRQLEITYRNTEGAKDWENAITQQLAEIDKDMVEEDITDINQMEG